MPIREMPMPMHFVAGVGQLINHTIKVNAMLHSPTRDVLENDIAANMKYVYSNTVGLLNLFYAMTKQLPSVSLETRLLIKSSTSGEPLLWSGLQEVPTENHERRHRVHRRAGKGKRGNA